MGFSFIFIGIYRKLYGFMCKPYKICIAEAYHFSDQSINITDQTSPFNDSYINQSISINYGQLSMSILFDCYIMLNHRF